MRKHKFSIEIAILLTIAIRSLPASVITWTTPTDESGNASDVVTTGTFLESAYTGTSDVILNGVTFDHSTSTANPGTFANGSLINFDGIDGFNSQASSAPSGWDSNYQSLTNFADYDGTNSETIVLGGLTVGDTYLIQIFEPWWNNQFPTSYNDGLGDSSSPLNTGYGQASPQFVTGTFVADGTSETLYTSASNTYTLTSAVQVRDIGGSTSPVPEPSSMGVLIAGMIGVGVAAYRRRAAMSRAEPPPMQAAG